MGAFDWMKTAEQLKPHDFELLVRAYCKRQAARARQPGADYKQAQIGFSFSTDRNGEMESASWKFCENWGDDTRGEILHNVVDEHVRRQVWASGERGKLLQIEG